MPGDSGHNRPTYKHIFVETGHLFTGANCNAARNHWHRMAYKTPDRPHKAIAITIETEWNGWHLVIEPLPVALARWQHLRLVQPGPYHPMAQKHWLRGRVVAWTSMHLPWRPQSLSVAHSSLNWQRWPLYSGLHRHRPAMARPRPLQSSIYSDPGIDQMSWKWSSRS